MKKGNDIRKDLVIFYMPFAYLYGVRLHSISKLLSWIGILLVPTLTYFILSLSDLFPWNVAVCSYLLLWFIIVPYYELGYMYNDTYTTLREQSPSLRLTPVQADHFYRHHILIFTIRLLFVGILMFLFGLLNSWHTNAIITLIWAALLLPVFMIYNHIRGIKAVLFYPVLVSWRYVAFLLYGWGCGCWWKLLALLLFSYPIEISIERFSMPKRRYGIMAKLIPNEPAKQRFRMIYYLCLSFILTILLLALHHPLAYAIPFYIFAIYRTCLYKLNT